MPTLDIFNDDAFGVTELTAKVNDIPYVPGQVSKSGLFEEDGVTTLTVLIEEKDGDLTLVEPSERGGPGETVGDNQRRIRPFMVGHYQRDDSIKADEVQGVRAFGTESDVETVEQKVIEKSARHTRALDATLEYSRVGAIKGIILDKNGNVQHNLYNEFGITEADAINFDLSNTASALRQLCADVIEQIEDALDGQTYSGIQAYTGRGFWKNFIDHKAVKETYLNTSQAAELRGTLMNDVFEFGGIRWERYRTGKRAKADVGSNFIADNEVRFVPLGVPELFITRFAPADYMETVNTRGLPRYAKVIPMPNGKGVNLEVQANFINLCTRPGALRKGVVSA